MESEVWIVNSCTLIRKKARASCTPRYEILGEAVAIQDDNAVTNMNRRVKPVIESRYGSTKICAPNPKMTPPMIAPPRRSSCFCRDEPMVERAVMIQVAMQVLSPGQSIAV